MADNVSAYQSSIAPSMNPSHAAGPTRGGLIHEEIKVDRHTQLKEITETMHVNMEDPRIRKKFPMSDKLLMKVPFMKNK